MAGAFQIGPDFRVVENLAIVNNPMGAVLVGHRLMAAGDVDNAQPPVSETGMGILIEAGVIGTPMGKGGSHSPQNGLGAPSQGQAHKTGYPAHSL
jgi:hypothetical protein